jgi:hypothetical protein
VLEDKRIKRIRDRVGVKEKEIGRKLDREKKV